MQTNHPSGSNPSPAALAGMMTSDEDELAERIADGLDASHSLHIATGGVPRVLDPGMTTAKAIERGCIVPAPIVTAP
jgi:hypothetical protein